MPSNVKGFDNETELKSQATESWSEWSDRDLKVAITKMLQIRMDTLEDRKSQQRN